MQTGRIKVIILISSVLICTVSFFVTCNSTPLDDELMKRFYKNQKDFNKIVKMLDRDPNIEAIKMRSFQYEDDGGPKISNERLKGYRSLFTKLGIENGFYRGADGGIYFVVYAQASIFSGSEKCYVFSTRKYKLVESLDVLKNSSKSEAWGYRKLKENWYLVYSKW